MMDLAPIVSLLPLAIPFAGAAIAWALPARSFFPRLRRWLYLAALLATGVLLISARSRGLGPVALPIALPGSPYRDALQFSFTQLGVGFGTLLVGALTLAGLSAPGSPMERSQAVPGLLLALSGVWTALAGSLLTLCMGWVLTDLALLSSEVIRAPEESVPHTVRRALTGLLSSLALVAATVLAETGLVSDLEVAGIPLRLVVLAGLLRLSPYPLPGSLKRRWPGCLASLCTGGYLWLRLASQGLVELAGNSWLLPLCASGLLVGGLLAGLPGDEAWPHLLLVESAALILLPLLDPQGGSAVAWVVAINAALALALVGAGSQVRSNAAWDCWSLLPGAIAMASLLGWPVTLGFAAHWSLLRLCWEAGLRSLGWVASLAYCLASVAMWRWLARAPEQAQGRIRGAAWSDHLALAGRSLGAALLLLAGVGLPLSPRLWSALGAGLPPYPQPLLFGGNAKLLGLVALTSVAVPLQGSRALYALGTRISGGSLRALQVVGAVVELDWLYLAVERAVTRLQGLVERAAEVVEGPFYLSWTLLWGLAVVLYLMGA